MPRQTGVRAQDITERDTRMVLLLSNGLSREEAAAQIFISPDAVGSRVTILLKKYNCVNVAHLCCYYLRMGWIQ